MTTPISGAELLSVADGLLASYDSAAPRPALLRRAISSAYYALFHDLVSQLVSQAVRHTVGTDPARDPDRHAIARFYRRGDLRAVSRWVLDRAQRRTLPDRVSALLDTLTPDLVLVASADRFAGLPARRRLQPPGDIHPGRRPLLHHPGTCSP